MDDLGVICFVFVLSFLHFISDPFGFGYRVQTSLEPIEIVEE